MMRRLWALFLRDLLTEISYPLAFILQFSGLFFSVLVFYFLSQLVGDSIADQIDAGDGRYFPYVLVGIAFSGYFGLGLNRFADALRTAQVTGTMEALLMTPSRLSTIIVGSVIYDYLFATLRVAVFLGMGIVLGVRFTNANWPAVLVTLVLAIVSFASIGIVAAGFTIVFKRGNPIIWLVSNLVTLLGGVYYPVSILPVWLQFIARLLPITYALDVARGALLDGAGWRELAPDLIALVGFCLLFPVSLLIFRAAVRKARVDGSLTHY
jgi:ABC-2 type transport system permease protein